MKKIVLDHDKVNLVYGTDTHLAAIPPGRRADDYPTTMLGKLRFWSSICHKYRGVGLHGGDLFHHKKPKAQGNTMGLIRNTIRTLKEFPLGGVWGIPGNHDLSWDDLSSLPYQPLGVVIASGAFRNLLTEPVIFTNRDETVSVLVEGYPYCEESHLLPLILQAPPRPLGVTYRVALLHAYGHPDAENATFGSTGIPYNPIGYDQLAKTDYDFCCWGHDHSRKEIATVGNVTHINFGSLARAALNMDEVDRAVTISLMSFSPDAMHHKEIPVPVKPLEVIFTMASKSVENAGKSEQISEFFSSMDEAIEGIESSEPKEVLKQLCPVDEPRLYDIAVEVCELE